MLLRTIHNFSFWRSEDIIVWDVGHLLCKFSCRKSIIKLLQSKSTRCNLDNNLFLGKLCNKEYWYQNDVPHPIPFQPLEAYPSVTSMPSLGSAPSIPCPKAGAQLVDAEAPLYRLTSWSSHNIMPCWYVHHRRRFRWKIWTWVDHLCIQNEPILVTEFHHVNTELQFNKCSCSSL